MDNTSKGTMLERNRQKLVDAGVLRRLIRHFNNELDVPLDSSQVNLGIAFMRKMIPDLTSTTMDVSVDHSGMNQFELSARVAALGYSPHEIWNQLNGQSVAIEHDTNTTDNVVKPGETINSDQDLIETPPPPE